jgi:NADH-quinone oxidoreductase subunit G
MQMLASVVKEHHAAASARRSAHVAIMPCTAKKAEAARAEFASRGQPNVDYVITTQELIAMIRESGIVFSELEAESADSPFGAKTGAGVIFGVTGGVTEAVLRRISSDKSLAGLRAIAMRGARGMDGVKETSAEIGGREVKIAIASGLKNASALIERIKAGERYGFVEIMACPGGCVSGAGQPYAPSAEKASRASGLYASDKAMGVKRSEENPLMMGLYSGLLRGKVRELLHVHYGGEDGSRHD